MDEKKLEKFCHEHDIDCNDCPLRDECSEYYGKYHELPARRYKGMTMANISGLPDPTAEQAVANVMKEGKTSRFLPKQLHKALKSLREVLSLVGYDVVDIRMRDRTDGREYLWSEWK